MRKEKSVSLVLGSGGARGLAHIGVIQWLEEHNYRIESISGCSIGALIGGIYAAGKLDEYEQWVRAINKLDIVTLLDLSWSRSGIFRGDRIINTLVELVGDIEIEQLPMRFTAVAADVKEEKEIWLNSGSLFDAIRASISLPFLFTPYHLHGLDLIDGGVLNPVPIAPTFSDKTELTIAVNLGGPYDPTLETSAAVTQHNDDSPFHQKVLNFINRFQQENGYFSRDDSWTMYEIAHQAFDAMQGTIARQKLAAYPPDTTIIVPRNACSILEFDRANEMIELGYKLTEEALS